MQSNVLKERKKKSGRKYDDSYIEFGFIANKSEGAERPWCVLCEKTLQNSSMAPSKLKRHLETVHREFIGTDKKVFAALGKKLQLKHDNKENADSENYKLTEASYKVSYRIGSQGEAHSIGEKLIKPCVKDCVHSIFGEKEAQKIDCVPLSNTTVQRRINSVSDAIEQELLSRLISCDAYALQMDESTDVAGLAVLLVFVRYDYENDIHEEMLLCEFLQSNVTGETVFDVIDTYIQKNNIGWEKCVDVCTDGAPSMIGIISGVVTRIKAVAPNCKSSHCMLHRNALVTKPLPPRLKTVLEDAVKIINFIKAKPLQTRVFKILCDDLGSLHTGLLLHTESRWLSRGKALTRLFELHQELSVYFLRSKYQYADRVTDSNWLMQLAYLADIFEKCNETNVSLQGKGLTVFDAKYKMKTFAHKLKHWLNCVRKSDLDCFPTLQSFVMENEIPFSDSIQKDIELHLEDLLKTTDAYFPNLNDDVELWVTRPFNISPDICCESLSSRAREELIDIHYDQELKKKFADLPLTTFWGSLLGKHPCVAKTAIKCLMPFATTYLCEKAFSTYAATKNKYRNRLDASADMRLQLSNIPIEIETICRQQNTFHASH